MDRKPLPSFHDPPRGSMARIQPRQRPPPTPYSTRPTELRHMVLNPRPHPALSIILVTFRHDLQLIESVCDHFAHDFHHIHINVEELLHQLAQWPLDRQALGLLRGEALAEALSKGREIAAFFLVPILLRAIGEHVTQGERRFVISGLDRYRESWSRFAEKIAEPAAVFMFKGKCGPNPGLIATAAMEKRFGDRMVVVEYDGESGVKQAYQTLLAALFAKASTIDGA